MKVFFGRTTFCILINNFFKVFGERAHFYQKKLIIISGVLICCVSVETLDLNTSKKLVSMVEKYRQFQKACINNRDREISILSQHYLTVPKVLIQIEKCIEA